VAHFWPMGESSGSSLADVVGGANAETVGGVTLGQPGGLVGDSSTSVSFNGSSGAAHASVNLAGTKKLTVEFWMKWKAFAGNNDLAMEFTQNFNEHPGGFLVDPNATPGSDFSVAVGQTSASHNNNALFERPSAEQWQWESCKTNATTHDINCLDKCGTAIGGVGEFVGGCGGRCRAPSQSTNEVPSWTFALDRGRRPGRGV
jgi:hypothetical protein